MQNSKRGFPKRALVRPFSASCAGARLSRRFQPAAVPRPGCELEALRRAAVGEAGSPSPPDAPAQRLGCGHGGGAPADKALGVSQHLLPVAASPQGDQRDPSVVAVGTAVATLSTCGRRGCSKLLATKIGCCPEERKNNYGCRNSWDMVKRMVLFNPRGLAERGLSSVRAPREGGGRLRSVPPRANKEPLCGVQSGETWIRPLEKLPDYKEQFVNTGVPVCRGRDVC
ncbi:uncharacterized protein LOC141951886 [Strix uralensis]|uniref:uncharacterized protein LOC141951886 n=1 Tax=Strix uralensis TaxID=36305 RepID=UPI003DA712AA